MDTLTLTMAIATCCTERQVVVGLVRDSKCPVCGSRPVVELDTLHVTAIPVTGIGVERN